MEYEILDTKDLSELQIQAIVEWQLREMLNGKACTICHKSFDVSDRNAIYTGKDKAGGMTFAHCHCYHRDN